MSGKSSSGVYRHYYNWFLWKVLAPYGFLLVIWPAYSLKSSVAAPFSSAFAHGELLVFAAVLLIEVSFEGEELRSAHDETFELWFDGVLPFLRFIALFVICLFGFISYDVLTLNSQIGTPDGHSESKLHAYALVSFALATTTVATAVFACVKHCEHELLKRWKILTTLGGDDVI